MWRVLVLALTLSLTAANGQRQQPHQQTEAESKAKTVGGQRESDLSRAIEKQELRHYELHRFFIPVTQGNLQWLTAMIGARPDEALVVWKLMRGWDASRAERMQRNPT